jgi:hypothetical protein
VVPQLQLNRGQLEALHLLAVSIGIQQSALVEKNLFVLSAANSSTQTTTRPIHILKLQQTKPTEQLSPNINRFTELACAFPSCSFSPPPCLLSAADHGVLIGKNNMLQREQILANFFIHIQNIVDQVSKCVPPQSSHNFL